MFRTITIAREYGSGGAEVGRGVAEKLGWELIDRSLIERVAAVGGVSPKTAAEFDEHAANWWKKLLSGYSHGGPELYVSTAGCGIIDEDSVHELTRSIIQQAAEAGHCVIVGRGAQCCLRRRSDVLNVLVYAPPQERIRRLQRRFPHQPEAAEMMRKIDSERSRYIRDYYDHDWLDRNLYHLWVSTDLGIAAAVDIIICAAKTGRNHLSAPSAG